MNINGLKFCIFKLKSLSIISKTTKYHPFKVIILKIKSRDKELSVCFQLCTCLYADHDVIVC